MQLFPLLSYKTRDILSLIIWLVWISLYSIIFAMLAFCILPFMSIWRYRLMLISLAIAIISNAIFVISGIVLYEIQKDYWEGLSMPIVKIASAIFLASLILFFHCYSSSPLVFIIDAIALMVAIKFILTRTEIFDHCVCDSVKSSGPPIDPQPYSFRINKYCFGCPLSIFGVIMSSTILLHYLFKKTSIVQFPRIFHILYPIYNIVGKIFIGLSILFSIVWIIDYSYLRCNILQIYTKTSSTIPGKDQKEAYYRYYQKQ